MPLNQTSGNVTTDAYGGGVAAVPNYIEDVFSTYLYTGTGASRSIVNGIDLSTKGGLVWTKDRSSAVNNNLVNTVAGNTKYLVSNQTGAQQTTSPADNITSFNTDGYSLGADTATNQVNYSGENYVSWTFRKQPKFFDVVTYTGTGANTTIAHSLGSVPGCIMVKATSGSASDWNVYHRSLGNTYRLILNATAQAYDIGDVCWNATTPTSTVFSLGTNSGVNASGVTYVAYLFAHDAGGFGLTGTDNVISCGSYTGNGSTSGPTVTLGYEPQWLMVKKTSNATNSNWFIVDNMRGFTADGSDTTLYPNLSNAEGLFNPAIAPTATGFQILNTGSTYNESGSTYIYIAIRRGPMKVPTDATKVFSPFTTAASTGTAVTTNFPVDFQLYKYRAGVDYWFDVDRLRGVNSTTTANSTKWLDTTATTAEASATNVSRNWGNTGFEVPGIVGGASNSFYSFQRAPSFFDEVCYTGTGSARAVTHNLSAVPEMMIVKNRGTVVAWKVYHSAIGNTNFLELNSTGASTASTTIWNDTAPTSSVFTVGSGAGVNQSGVAQVAYLFATCAGVSKIFSFTGNGTSQTINCGFTGGARFVLLKATSTTGGWYVYDTARGMTTLTDPYLFLNSTAAESATLGSVTTVTTGFAVNESILAGVNKNGVSYIGLAIA